jgi:hypothetical protein
LQNHGQLLSKPEAVTSLHTQEIPVKEVENMEIMETEK